MPDRNVETLLAAALAKVKYRQPEQTRRDVLALLRHYRGLVPQQDKFIFNDGVQRDLINIFGTIPVPYKGQSYNIPISLWLMDSHPYHAPICYVKPTADMQIKVSKHVDHSGAVYLPYLHDWAPQSELLGLIQMCIVAFSEQPPVYSKPKEQAAAGPLPPAPAFYPQPPVGGGGYPGYPGYPAAGVAFPVPGAVYPFPCPTSQDPPPAGAQEPPGASARLAEKVRAKLREECAARQAETDSLRQVGEELVAGQGRLQAMVARLHQETRHLEGQVDDLSAREGEMAAEADRLEGEGEVSCDEAVCGATPLHSQLLAAAAEESATEDAIYFLGEALRRGAIDCESFLRHVRQLSRRQFMLRATMHKARRTAGLKL